MYGRREFLLRTIWLAMLPGAEKASAVQQAEPGAKSDFSTPEFQTLAAAMDGIVPAGDSMPSATAAGGLQYLRYLGFQYPEINESIRRILIALAEVARDKFGADFPHLQSDQRILVLAALEERQPAFFSNFTAYVYEAYYTSPLVLGLIACTAPALPAADDEVLLAPVRKMALMYREVP